MPHAIAHPSSFLEKTLTDTLRTAAAPAEKQRSLTDGVLGLIREQKWFTMFVPTVYGGSGLPLPEVLAIEECLSWADGSVGWVVTLCSGAGWFAGFLEPGLAAQVLMGGDVCVAGSGAVAGVAERVADGYSIQGHWPYASGSLHATVFTVNAHLHQNGRPLFHPDGQPQVKAFVLLRDEVTVHTTWRGMGMVATGTHALEVQNLLVPHNRAFIIDPRHAVLADPVFRYPFQSLAETTLSINLSGMAMRFLDLCGDNFAEKIQRDPQQHRALLLQLAAAQTEMNNARALFYHTARQSWEQLLATGNVTTALQQHVRRHSLDLARCARRTVVDLYPLCGLRAANTETEINRVWRNLNTASQHAIFLP